MTLGRKGREKKLEKSCFRSLWIICYWRVHCWAKTLNNVCDFRVTRKVNLGIGDCRASEFLKYSYSYNNIVTCFFSKCIPVLLYGLESLSLTLSDVRSLDFTYNRFLIKLFKTADMNIIKDCQAYFGTQLPSEILTKRCSKFLEKYSYSTNCLCHYFSV